MNQNESIRVEHDTAWNDKSSAITSDQSAPSGATAGRACVGKSIYQIQTTDLHSATTDHTVNVYVTTTTAATDWVLAQTFPNCGSAGQFLEYPLNGDFKRVAHTVTGLVGTTKSLKTQDRVL